VLTATPTSQEQAGVWARQPGSHADAAWLLTNRPNDYSLRGTKQRVFTANQGKYGRAWDWTFPSAQRGDWSEIGVYSERIRVAWETDDPRTYPLFEVLCQTPEDAEPEGYVFYPDKRFRVPDATHKWHLHNGILTQHIDDPAAFEALYSLYSGEPLAAWRARTQGDDDMTPEQANWLKNVYHGLFFGGVSMGDPVDGKVNDGSAGNAVIDLLQHLRNTVDALAKAPAAPVALSAEDRVAIVDALRGELGGVVRAELARLHLVADVPAGG